MKIKSSFLLSLLAMAISGAYAQATKFIPATNKSISFMGRVGHNDSCAAFFWTGSSATIKVNGADTVKAILSDSKGINYFYVIVDGDSSTANKIMITQEKKAYTLAVLKDQAKHTVQLFKVTNTNEQITRLFGFEIKASAKLLKPEKKPKRCIEFFGNSITCGHGVDVPVDSADSGASKYFNNYKAYGAITARHFNAQYHCTAKSGIGVTISWFSQIMPEIYDRLDPNDVTSKWNFDDYTPDVVVVNLFQNDSWLVNQPDHEQFKARFGTTKPTEVFIIQAYANFIQSIRSKYPKANIVCCLGNMDGTREGSPWPSYIKTAAASLQDKKITTLFFADKKSPGHPKVKEHQAMADALIHFIEINQFFK